MRRAGLVALLSHWWRRPLQLAMLLLGLSVATALWSGVQAINAEARASYAEAAATLGQDRLAQLLPTGASALDDAAYVALRRAGWLVSPVVEGRVRRGDRSYRVLGIDPLTLPAEAREVNLSGAGDLGAFISGPGIYYAGPDTAEALRGAFKAPVETAESLPPGTLLMDIGEAQRLLGTPGEISRLLVATAQPEGLAPLAELAPGLRLKQPGGESDLQRLTDSFHLNLTAFGFLAFAVGLFIVYAAVGLAFEQRRPVFRTLRALGLPARGLVGLLLVELLLLALIAGVIGVLLGYAVAAVLLPDVAATLRGLYGAEVSGQLSIEPGWWAAGLGIAVLGTMISAAQGLWRVWRLPLLAPAQPRAWARASARGMLWQAGGAAILLLGAGGLAIWGSGLVVGFLVLAALLLGAALVLPALLSGVLSLAARFARSALAEWFWADTRQQLPGLSLALMALMLALAANVGVGTMVASFRLTFTGWLDQRLASELYVTARSEDEARRLATWLQPRADAVLPIWSTEGTVANRPAQIYGVADHPTYRDHWPLLSQEPGVWDRVAAGTGVLVNEQLWRRANLAIGETLPLPGGWSAEIVGVYSDYGNPLAQVLVGTDALVAHYPDVPRLRYGIRIAPAKAAALAGAIETEFGLPGENIVDQASIKAFSLGIFERTFAVTGALNVLTLGVATLAMVASLVTLAGMRLPQLAPVWAIGLTRRRLAWIELGRTVLLAVLTMIAAIPVGIGLAWVLLAVVNVEAFGWRLPMHLFPLEWLRLGALALVAALIAAAGPARKLARIPPVTLLGVFANER